MPMAACSAGWPPIPMPRTRRPPLITCSVEAIRASTAGWRFMTLATNVPSCTCCVTVAVALRMVHASTTGTVLSPRPMKWSHDQTPA